MTGHYIALVPAAGSGTRFGGPSPKQYLQLLGRPLMWYTLHTLSQVKAIDQVALVLSPQDEWFDGFEWDIPKLIVYRVGGATRAESVYRGLAKLALPATDWVLVHDAVRCCVSLAAIERLLGELAEDAVGGLLALPVPDTIKRVDAELRVSSTLSRHGLWLAQTPQMFRAGTLWRALSGRTLDNITDEASAIELIGLQPRLVQGEATNFKVTWPHDLVLAQAILEARKG